MKRWEEADLSKKPQNSEISLGKEILRYSASVNGGVRYRGEGEREESTTSRTLLEIKPAGRKKRAKLLPRQSVVNY